MAIITDGGGGRRVDINDLLGYLWDFVRSLATLQWWRANQAKDRIGDWFKEAFDIIKDHASRKAREARDRAWGWVQDVWSDLGRAWNAINEHWTRLKADAWEGFYYITDYIGRKKDEAIGTVWGWVKGLWESVGLSQWDFSHVVADVKGWLEAWKEELTSFASDPWGYIKKKAEDIWRGITGFFADVTSNVWNAVVTRWPWVEDLKRDPIGFIMAKLGEGWDAFWNLVKTPFTWLDNLLRANFPLYNLLRDDPGEFLLTLVETFNPDVADFIRDPLKWLWEVFLPWLLDKIWDWLNEPV